MRIGGLDSTTGGPSAIHTPGSTLGVAAFRESRSRVKSSILRCNSVTDVAASPVHRDSDSSNCCNRASPSCTSSLNTTFCSRALEMTASTRLTLCLARSTKFLHSMICSSKGRTLALERAIRKASTKGFANGFPSPTLPDDAPVWWPLRKLCRECNWGIGEVGTSQTDFSWDALLAGQLCATWGYDLLRPVLLRPTPTQATPTQAKPCVVVCCVLSLCVLCVLCVCCVSLCVCCVSVCVCCVCAVCVLCAVCCVLCAVCCVCCVCPNT